MGIRVTMTLGLSVMETIGATRARPQLGDEGTALLHAALENVTADTTSASSAGLKRAVQRICLDARRNDWPPEHLIVAFKTALTMDPAVQRVAPGVDRDALMSRIVSLCIVEYYETPNR